MGLSEASKYFNLGNEYLDSEDYESAISNYTKGININPRLNTDIYKYRGDAYFYSTDVGPMEADLNLSYCGLYGGLEQIEKYKNGIADYSQVIEFDPTYFEAYYRRGEAYFRLEEYKKAIADYLKGIKLDDGHDKEDVYLMCAYCSMKLNDDRKVIKYLTKILRLKWWNTSVLSMRIDYYFKVKEYKKAIKDCTVLYKLIYCK